MNRFFTLFISLSILLCAACDPSELIVRTVTGDTIAGSGQIIRENRDLSPFDSVEVSGSMDVEITRGEELKCVVEGDDNIVPLVKTEVINRTLNIYVDQSFSINQTLNVYLEVPEISGVLLSGSGDIEFTDVTRDRVEILIDGSGDITATGEVEILTAKINGSGDMHLFNLYSENATVEVNGSGDIEVSVNNSLDCEINGSGDIRYSGNPTSVKRSVNGSGDIIQAD